MNDNHHNQSESVEEQIERLEIQKIRLETQLIEAGMRRDRVRLVLDIVKWTVITGLTCVGNDARAPTDQLLHKRQVTTFARRTRILSV